MQSYCSNRSLSPGQNPATVCVNAACAEARHSKGNRNQTLSKIPALYRETSLLSPPEQLTKGKRYVLCKVRENICQDAGSSLRNRGILDRNLYLDHLRKEQFRQVFRAKAANTATPRLLARVRICMRKSVKILRNFSGKSASDFTRSSTVSEPISIRRERNRSAQPSDGYRQRRMGCLTRVTFPRNVGRCVRAYRVLKFYLTPDIS